MKIEASVQEIRALLRIAELDGIAQELAPATYLSRREASLRHVPQALLDRYESLLEAGRYPVVVAIETGTCSGCHVRLPTLIEYRARRTPAIHTCPHCRRMVYASELLSGESATPAAEKGGRGLEQSSRRKAR